MCVYSDARGGLVEYTQQLMLASDMVGVGGGGEERSTRACYTDCL